MRLWWRGEGGVGSYEWIAFLNWCLRQQSVRSESLDFGCCSQWFPQSIHSQHKCMLCKVVHSFLKRTSMIRRNLSRACNGNGDPCMSWLTLAKETPYSISPLIMNCTFVVWDEKRREERHTMVFCVYNCWQDSVRIDNCSTKSEWEEYLKGEWEEYLKKFYPIFK